MPLARETVKGEHKCRATRPYGVVRRTPLAFHCGWKSPRVPATADLTNSAGGPNERLSVFRVFEISNLVAPAAQRVLFIGVQHTVRLWGSWPAGCVTGFAMRIAFKYMNQADGSGAKSSFLDAQLEGRAL